MNYIFMHKNERVADVEINSNGIDLNVNKVFAPELLPYNVQNNTTTLKSWWNARAVPKSQMGIDRFLSKANITTYEFLLRNLGLSLIDSYWVKPISSDLTWDDVNLFSNEFSSRIRLESKEKGFSPNASIQGQLEKEWIIENNQRFLLKYSDGIGFPSINEVFASNVLNKQGLKVMDEYVPYSLVETKSQRISKCPIFLNENIEFIPAIEIVLGFNNTKEISYKKFINGCEKIGLDIIDVEKFMDFQTQFDFLITNVDRHMNNFGIIRDSNTLKPLKMAPIFDNGDSMFHREVQLSKTPPAMLSILKTKTNTFNSLERNNLSRISEKNITNFNSELIPTNEEVYNFYSEYIRDEVTILNIVGGFESKVKLLKMFQEGKSLGQYYKELMKG